MSTTLPLFWPLSSASTDERLDASVKLINGLEQFQDSKAAAPIISSDSEDSEDDSEELNEGDSPKKSKDDLNSEDVKYALRRLIRGLASPRESSRLGFSVALTELLTRLNTVDAASITSSILEASAISNSMKGQEVRDTLFARLFGLTAVIQSGLLFRTSRLTTSPSAPEELGLPASSLVAYQTTVTELFNLGEKKSWLRESSWWSIDLALRSLHSSQGLEWKDQAIQWTIETIYRGDQAKEWTPEKLGLTVTFKILLPINHGKTSSHRRSVTQPWFRPPTCPLLPEFLKKRIPPKNQMSRALREDGKSKASFAEFYRICVDESLFATASSSERKSWGFQVFERALTIMPSEEYQYLFTPNFMRTWINHLSAPDRHLHKAAKKAASDIVKAVERNPSIGFSLVTHLQGAHGNQQFDRITRTKTVETILASTDIDGVKKYTTSLVNQLRDGVASERYVFEQLAALMRNGSIPKDDEWIKSVLELFILHGLFTVTKKNKNSELASLHHTTKPPLSDALRSACESGESTRTNSSAADGELWITKAAKIVEILEQESSHVSPLAETEGDVTDLRARARKVLKSIRRKQTEGDDASRGTELLISALLLETYNDGEDNVDSLESCLDATEKLFNLSKEVKSSEEDEHSPIDLLIDVIIGMLEKSSAFGKSVATQAFGLLSGRVESTTIDLILLQLEQRDVNESENGEDEDEAAEAVDEMAEAEEDDEDEKSEDDSGSDSDDDSTDGDENEELEVDPEFRKQVAEALRVNGMAIAEDEDEDSDSDSEEEVLLDDDQMMQLDEQLAKVFRAHAGGSKEKKSAQREATHFKIRILDWLIFLSKQLQSAYAPRVVLPLVNIAISAGPDERQLSEKTVGILRARIGKTKDIPTGEIDKEATIKDLRDLHELARKTPIPELSACSIYLSKVLQGDLQVLEAYRASIEDFARRKNSKLSPAFLKEFILRQTPHAWQLREHIAGQAAPGVAVNVYRQMQMWQLLQTLLSQVTPLCQEAEVVEQLFSFIPLIRDALYKSLTTACEQTEHSANAAQVKELLKIALQAMRLARKVARPSDSISSSWDVSAFEKVREQLANSDRFKGSPAIQSSTKQVLSLLVPTSNGTVPTNKKRKETAEEVTINGTETEPRKKRKKVKKQKIDRTATND
ncbi:DNA polymerase phi subunit [Rhizoctonia solani]|uniref:DNA polymerase phi subunit n=1 Tax=Rhizoctonia solani TaxID=456999 RepID=A0A8H8P997_9AGAM|nr:DNA polymerase phi subunit [Rhizoctonia solani]QRW27168.1 DNA polymerase phi subunit [Rhizoctonia solani]